MQTRTHDKFKWFRGNGIPTRLRRIVALVLVGTTAPGCTSDELRQAAVAVAVIDATVPEPARYDLLCDPSPGSTCTAETLSKTVAVVVSAAIRRPGSRIIPWLMGPTGDKLSAGEAVVIGPLQGIGRRARARAQAAESLWVTTSLLGALAPLGQVASGSPLIESVSKIRLLVADTVMPRTIVVISDGMEESPLGHFECGKLPAANAMLDRYRQQGLWGREWLRGVRVSFVYTRFEEIDRVRCRLTLERIAEIRTLWQQMVEGAGGTLDFNVGLPDLRAGPDPPKRPEVGYAVQ